MQQQDAAKRAKAEATSAEMMRIMELMLVGLFWSGETISRVCVTACGMRSRPGIGGRLAAGLTAARQKKRNEGDAITMKSRRLGAG